MSSKTGVWLDSKKAVIVKLKDSESILKLIESGIEGREREPGQGKKFGRFGMHFISFEKSKQRKNAEKEKRYFKSIIDEIRSSQEVVVFGPSETKTKLEKEIIENKSLKIQLSAVKDADSMSDNQISAWVKDYFKK